jgi:hypothetical protein
MANKTPFN